MSNVVKLPPTPAPETDVDFSEEFWQAFPNRQRQAGRPRQVARDHRRRAQRQDAMQGLDTYVELGLLKATPEELIEGAKRYYQENRLNGKGGKYGFKDDGRYLQRASTWLNQAGWEDG